MKDRLWDMPITNSTIKENYELPSSHAALCHQNKKAHAHASPLKCRKHSKNHNQNKLNVIIRKKQTHKELAQHLHTTCYSPRPSAFIKVIKNNQFISWPGLNAKLIDKHLPKSIATSQGHLISEKQGLQSTKQKKQSC